MEPSTSDLKNAAASAGSYAGDKARQVAKNVSDKLHSTESRAEDMYHMARERAEEYYDTSVDFVKKYPVSTVAGAAAIGFIAGILLRRSRH